MPKRKLLQIGNITSRMADRLEPEFDIIEYFKSQNKEKLISDNAKDIVCVLTDGHWGVPDNLIERLTGLEIISSYGVGYDAIDADFAASKNIVVTHTPEILNMKLQILPLCFGWPFIENLFKLTDGHGKEIGKKRDRFLFQEAYKIKKLVF